ncbi:hypothetical protein FA95DRAFT_1130762 [Auriscalpium vulgare]|uniref:Uncharacterized protein n=1 Tax=Auriscalpium vulgare TaxID=40419 RepID=A0ACB8RW60_9AGAM|nr:hypothetical protein FA95DRAFT_1130762 [Auriscalpium vulgare]
MDKPVLLAIPENDVNILVALPALQHKVIVTETYLTPAYFMCLSTVSNPVSVNVELQLTDEGLHTEEAASSGSSLKWAVTTEGFTQVGATPNGEYGYVPLFRLVRRPVSSQKRCREDCGCNWHQPPADNYRNWIDHAVPWRALDNEGTEFVDVVSDDEDDY